MSDKKELQPWEVIIGPIRFSYLRVFEPVAYKGVGEKKYSVSVLIKKTDKENLKKIETAIRAAAEKGKDKVFNGKVPVKLKTTLNDGDEKADEAYQGHMFLNTKNAKQPKILDANNEYITEQRKIYSGAYGYISLSFYASALPVPMIACSFDAIRKTKDGKPLDGTKDAKKLFEFIEIEETPDDIDSLL